MLPEANARKAGGLDGKTILPVPYRRGRTISLDIPFYRTGLSECGPPPAVLMVAVNPGTAKLNACSAPRLDRNLLQFYYKARF